MFPVWLGLGFGLGKVYGEAGGWLTAGHDSVLAKAVGKEEVKSK